MRTNRPLDFENLEGRQLLATAKPLGPPALAGHEVHAMVTSRPIDLSGTLTVNAKGKQSAYDPSGGLAVSMPIRGDLNGVGPVRGFWVQTQDPHGRLTGPDELHLQNAKGKLTISFRNPLAANAATPAQGAHGVSSVVAAQRVTGGSRAYANLAEAGTVAMTIGDSGRSIRGLVLATDAGIYPR